MSTISLRLGFLSILQEPTGTLGGYLVTNSWGRPLEFRLSSAVQPNRVQQILYGESLPGFLCGELIGKTLVEKSQTPVQMVLTDHPHALAVRTQLSIPVGLYWPAALPTGIAALPANGLIHVHGEYSQDVEAFAQLLAELPTLDWAEPFLRIREAIVEARRLGVAQRPAAA